MLQKSTDVKKDDNNSIDHGTTKLKTIQDHIVENIKSSIDTKESNYKISISENKIKQGCIIINLSLRSKKDKNVKKRLVFEILKLNILVHNENVYNVSVLSINTNYSTLLFTTNSNNIDSINGKISKYLPTILNSTKKMMNE